MVNHCKWLLNNGCNGLVILGTTGEANSFSISERKKIIDCLVNGGIPKEVMVVGTGTCSLTDTIDLSKHVLNNGINSLLLLPPFYYKNVSDEGLHAFFDHVIQSVTNSNSQIYLYHIPPVSHVPITIGLLDRLLKKYPDTLVGIKDSGGEFEHMKMILNNFPQLEIFAGTEEFLIDILEIGGVGCISASVNVTCKLAAGVYREWIKSGESHLFDSLLSIRRMIESYPVIPALKYIMAKTTDNQNWMNIRPPLNKLNIDQSHKLDDDLVNLNFLSD